LEKTGGKFPDRREVAAGTRAYSIGFEDGRFYANGWHITGEMGGVWTPPLKLVDGVWFGLDGQWVGPATKFSSGWGYTRYELPTTAGLSVARTDFVPDGRRGAHGRWIGGAAAASRTRIRGRRPPIRRHHDPGLTAHGRAAGDRGGRSPVMSHAEPSVLIVDDERVNIDLMVDLLKPHYRTLVATNGEQALKRAAGAPRPDILLLDVMMPGMDGYEVCRQLKSDAATQAIPVIFVTAMSEMGDEMKGFALGAVDYITKPISPPIVEARVRAHLENKHARDFIEDRNRVLQGMVLERTRELAATQDATILSMATLAETRDPETGHHLQRTQGYVRSLAVRLRAHPRFRDELDDKAIELLFKSAPLHDIGKVGVPDRILRKPAKLTPEEYEEMKRHVVYGYEAIVATEKLLASAGISSAATSFLRYAREIARSHHEKWDGTGYPDGLGGDEIPLSARLMMMADVYDALTSKRCYKPAYSHAQAVAEILPGRGTYFDPDVVDATASALPRGEHIRADDARSPDRRCDRRGRRVDRHEEARGPGSTGKCHNLPNSLVPQRPEQWEAKLSANFFARRECLE
jgi:putative two-component system response regulator